MAYNVGTLVHDGPATPHQLALYLPITGTLGAGTFVTCQYRRANTANPSSLGEDEAWITDHNLYRIRSDLSDTPDVGEVANAFAWTIIGPMGIGLQPNTPYEVKLTIDDDAQGPQELTHQVFTTRQLPPSAGRPNKTISAGSSSAQIQTAFNGLAAGDVLQFEDGNYSLANVTLAANGSSASPIYVRGESREGVVLTDTSGAVLDLHACDYLVLENLSLVGSGVDDPANGGFGASSIAVKLNAGYTHDNVTIRNVTASGVDRFVVGEAHEVTSVLVYDCVAVGNNLWNATFLGDNRTWNDDCLQLSGQGNCAFRNTLKNFGDTFSYAAHSDGVGSTYTYGVHFYLNDVWNSCDDLAEVDEAHRNLTCYDNRVHNAMTLCSLDRLYGGPFICVRNILFNVGRDKTVKCGGAKNSGYFLYSNTVVGSGSTASNDWTLYQNEGIQDSFGFQNNLFVFRSTPEHTVTFDASDSGYTTVDFSNNAFYPDGDFWWKTSQGNLATTYAALPATTPIFSGQTKRHEGDRITVSDPFTTTVTLGAAYTDAATEQAYPIVNDSSVVDKGAQILGITPAGDSTPNIGAVMDGFIQPLYGNTVPSWVKALDIGEWYEIPNSNLSQLSGTTDKQVNDWCSWAFDPVRSRVLIVCATGHTDSNNQLAMFDIMTGAWSELLAQTASGDKVDNATHWSDGRPAARHTYRGILYSEKDDKIVLLSGSKWSNGLELPTVDGYNIGKNAYDPAATYPNCPSGYGAGEDFPTFAIDQSTGDLYSMVDNSNMRRLPFSNQSAWVNPSPTGSTTAHCRGHAGRAVDTKRGRIFVRGNWPYGQGEAHHYYDIVNNNWVNVTLAGARAADVVDGDSAAITYIPELDVFLYKRQFTNDDVIQIGDLDNASTWQCTTYATSGGSSIPDDGYPQDQGDGGKPYDKFFYVQKMGVVWYYPAYTYNAWALKVADVEPTIPGNSEGGGEVVAAALSANPQGVTL